jgi:hypothetical protein
MEMRKRGRIERDELISLLFLALLFFVLLIGRELGSIYGSYGEISKLSVLLQMDEEDLADYIVNVLRGEDTKLDVGISLTLPSVSNVEGIVTELPDYIRRIMISVALSPIVVRQPEVSIVEMRLLVEDDEYHFQQFQLNRVKIPYVSYLERSFELKVENMESFKEAIMKASELHGGEVKITFTGRALVHVLLLKNWLPFSTTRYPLVQLPHIEFESSHWINSEGIYITRSQTDHITFVQFTISNPTRIHSLHENVTINFYKEGEKNSIQRLSKIIPVAPGTSANYVFKFIPQTSGTYTYDLQFDGVLKLNKTNSQRLQVDN